MNVSSVQKFFINQGVCLLTECKGSAVQTAMVAASAPLGLFLAGLALYKVCYKKSASYKSNLLFGTCGAIITLLAANSYCRIIGAIFTTYLTYLMAKGWYKDSEDGKRTPLESKITAALAPTSVLAALTIRAYLVKG